MLMFYRLITYIAVFKRAAVVHVIDTTCQQLDIVF